MAFKLNDIRPVGRFVNPATNKPVWVKKGNRVGRGTDHYYYLSRGKRVFVNDADFQLKWARVKDVTVRKAKPVPPTLGKVENTGRGFEFIRFRDRSDVSCKLQVSSLADHAQPGVSAIWIGPCEASPMVMAREAHLVGLPAVANPVGWVPYPVPPQVLMHTQAHLDRSPQTHSKHEIYY